MLTVKQPVHYGFKSAHDLPTPPSTSRPSPPLIYQDEALKRPHAIPRTTSPSGQPMSGPHRGLPPPAAMTLAQPPLQHGAGPPPPAGSQMGQVSAPPQHSVHQQNSSLGQLPAPPQWQQGPDESMRAWLHAKAEEEKRRQEEEKTRQESLRLEQRRTEHEILRTSLQGGIPPPMVPVVFAGMGGNMLPQAALEWAHQFMHSQVQSHQQHPHQPQPQLPPASGHVSPEHRRDSQSQAYGAYQPSGGVPPTPGSIQGPHGSFGSHPPGSPARPRGYSVPGARAPPPPGPSNLPALNTNVPQGGPGGAQPPHAGAVSAHQQSDQAQSSPSIYFHHWHPPASQAASGGSNQPATPSEKPPTIGESPQRKRKATGPVPGPPPPSSQQRLRSPPFVHSSTSAGGRRRGHMRQRSDLSLYRPSGRGNGGPGGRQDPPGGGGYGNMSPSYSSAPSSAREGDMSGESSRQQQHHANQPQHAQQQQQHHPPPQGPPSRSGPHSVSSLLSEEPSPRTMQYQPSAPEPERRDDSPVGTTRSGGPMRPRNNE
ncbi:hypothetical protein RB597_000618 [Gaeumannomyces tritici]